MQVNSRSPVTSYWVRAKRSLEGFGVTYRIFKGLLAAAAVGLALPQYASSQALPTATQTFQLSAFAGATGVCTGLNGSRNLGFTAGASLGVPPIFRFYPSITVRGTYPVDSGVVAGEKSALAGIQMEKHFGRFHPYFDILAGRGELSYVKLYPDPQGFFYYSSSTSNVFSPGGGVDIDLTPQLALKADVQYQHYSVPVTTSGSIESIPITLGAVYRFDFNRHHRR